MMLEVDNLTKEFGGIIAVDSVSFEIEEQTITGLLGPNGAGKSTTFDLISGLVEPTEGDVVFKGEQINDLPLHKRTQRGMIRSYQLTHELRGMTVMENMLVGAPHPPDEKVINAILDNSPKYMSEQREKCLQLLDLLELREHKDTHAGNLSSGQRKLLELGRALMTDPDLLLLDEPMAGVNPNLIDNILDRIEELRNDGKTFLIIEHDIESLMRLSDQVIGMVDGQVQTIGTPNEVREDSEFREAYIGRQ